MNREKQAREEIQQPEGKYENSDGRIQKRMTYTEDVRYEKGQRDQAEKDACWRKFTVITRHDKIYKIINTEITENDDTTLLRYCQLVNKNEF